MDVQIVSADIGQVWRDEDGLAWVIVAFSDNGEWLYVKRLGHPHSQAFQTNPAWLTKWTKIVEADGRPVKS